MTTQPAEDTNPIPSLRALAEKESGIDEDVNYGSDDEGMHYDVIMVNSSTNLNSEKELPATPQATKKGSQLSRTVGPYIEGMRAKLKARLEKAEKAPSRSRQKSVEKAMLLHAYPIFYIILWIPGIAMRIAQVSGHSPYALQVMQASTQYIGFANAITFGWNERIGAQLRAKILGEEMV
ncbi:hypothetical protein PVAG01_09849 [Phlyctema vagabunda]|uniref:G protein-coupled receptor GPR1/2/3 C-terminal domain-containing protein n=1 Tax=Phlyctema vagabunda TaxID=108571 RepID=A0ABR4P4A4_9HELO